MSSLSTTAMRELLSKQYKGATKWRLRVAKMSDTQVLTVYNRMLGVNKKNAND